MLQTLRANWYLVLVVVDGGAISRWRGCECCKRVFSWDISIVGWLCVAAKLYTMKPLIKGHAMETFVEGRAMELCADGHTLECSSKGITNE